MGTRYCEAVEVEVADPRAPRAVPRRFCWRGARYDVVAVLGHWREDAGHWTAHGIDIPQRDLWRVEVGGRRRGVFELVHERGVWRLARIWD